MKTPRFLHRLYAYLLGYFWKPCPICSNYFGGHEHNRCATLYTSPGMGKLTCPDCIVETESRNIDNGLHMSRWVEVEYKGKKEFRPVSMERDYLVEMERDRDRPMEPPTKLPKLRACEELVILVGGGMKIIDRWPR